MSSSSPPSISLIVPAYNEEKRIGETVRALSAYLESRHPDSELLIVCDGCKDRTAEVARQSFANPALREIADFMQPWEAPGLALMEAA